LSISSVPSLRLEPAAPRIAAAGLVVLALLAACAVAMSGLAFSVKLALLLLTGVLLAREMRALLQPWPLLEWDDAGQWWLHGGGEGWTAVREVVARPDPLPPGEGLRERVRSERGTSSRLDPSPADLLGAARLGPLLVLRLRIEGRRRALLLTPDRLPAADLRRLRVRLGLG
jgi:hypothetical protein